MQARFIPPQISPAISNGKQNGNGEPGAVDRRRLRRLLALRNERESEKHGGGANGAGQHHRGPSETLGNIGLDGQSKHRAERPAHLQQRHRKDDFAAVEPVHRHLGRHQNDDRRSDAADRARDQRRRKTIGAAQRRPGNRHHREPGKPELLFPEALSQQPGRKCDDDAGQQIGPEQHADFRVVDSQILHQQVRGRSDRLELESRRRARREQDRQDHPSSARHPHLPDQSGCSPLTRPTLSELENSDSSSSEIS